MTPDRPEAEIEAMSALFARHLPGLAARSVTRLGEGMDHVAYEADGGLILRMSKEPDPARRADRIRREAALLALVAEISPLPVPRVILSDPDAGVLGYVKLPGRPLTERPVAEPGRLAPALGEFLTRLHLAPPERFSALAAPDTQPLTAWLAEAERHHRAVAAHLPAAARRRIEAFLGGAPPAEPRALAFCHNDLGAEHVLAEGGTVTGVIDWSDAEIADPAYDLGLLYRDLGPEVTASILAHYAAPWDDAAGRRAVFYARCALLEDLAYGLRTGPRRYAEAALAHLDRTFSAWG